MNSFKCFAIDHRSLRENAENSLVNFYHPDELIDSWVSTCGKFGADYGELRALESFAKSEYLYGGVFHYRRVLLLSKPDSSAHLRTSWEGSYLPYWNWSYTPEFDWTAEKLETFSLENRIFLPNPVDVNFGNYSNLYDQFLGSHPKIIFEALLETWDGADSFISFLKKENKLIPYNMAIFSRSDAIQVCDWLFPILTELEDKLISLSSDKYNRRWPGFLAERLLTYYWSNLVVNRSVTYCDVGRLDESLEVDFFLKAKGSKCAFTSFDGNYLLPAFNMIASVGRYISEPIDFICITTVKRENFAQYAKVLEELYPHVTVHRAEINYEEKKIPWGTEGNWPIPTLFRFLGPTLTDNDKIAWLDGDTVTTKSISNLWDQWEPNFAVFAAQDLYTSWVRQVKFPSEILGGESWENYYSRILPRDRFPIIFQAGVLLMDLRSWRNESAVSQLLTIAAKNRFPAGHDQDLINLFFEMKIKQISQSFNYVNQYRNDVLVWSNKVSNLENRSFQEWLNIENPGIIHYTGYLIPKPFYSSEPNFPLFQHYWHQAASSPFMPSLLLKIASSLSLPSQTERHSKKNIKNAVKIKFLKKNRLKRALFLIGFKMYSLLPNKVKGSKEIMNLKYYFKRILSW
jgi:lipopolysaccharide biosynthesis glycosyltransferase